MSRQLRFLADENFNQAIVEGLRSKQPEIDIQTVVEAGLLQQSDPLVLTYVADHDRILLSHDVRTMPGHFTDLLASGRHSPGVFLIAQTESIGRAISEILMLWEASTAEEWHDQCNRLPL